MKEKVLRKLGKYYCTASGWKKNKDLDYLCGEQRDIQIWIKNHNYKGRRFELYDEQRMNYLAKCDSERGKPDSLLMKHRVYREAYNKLINNQ